MTDSDDRDFDLLPDPKLPDELDADDADFTDDGSELD